MSKKLKRFLRPIIFAVIIIGLIFGFYVRKKGAPPIVVTVEVKKAAVVQSVSASGILFPDSKSIVYAPLAGKLATLKIEDGGQVVKGQVLAIYDQIPLQAQLAQAESSLATAQKNKEDLRKTSTTNLELLAAKTLVEQRKELLRLAKEALEKEGTSPNLTNYNAALTTYQDALANLEKLEKNRLSDTQMAAADRAIGAAEKTLASTKHDLSQSIVRAPVVGIVTLGSLVGGDPIGSGSAVTQGQEIFTIASPENLVFRAEIDDVNVVKVKEKTETEINLDAYHDKTFVGKVKSINAETHKTPAGGQAYYVYVQIEQGDVGFRSGMSGQADFIQEKINDVLTLPNETILDRDGKKIVFVLDGDKVKSRAIETGASNDSLTEIKKGLSAGQKIVTGDMVKKLKDGQKIKEK